MLALLRAFFWVFFILTGYVLLSSSYVHSSFWLISFFATFIPLLFVVNLLFLFFWLFSRKYLFVVLATLLFVIGIPALKKTLVYNEPVAESPDIKLMSYNVGTFNLKRWHKIEDTINPKKMMEWFRQNTDADIICLQEFFNNSISDVENTVEAITGIKNLYYYYTNPIFWEEIQGFFGVITFSRFPIIHSGPLIFGDSSINRGVYLDLKIKGDTVRVINIHLHSMSIRLDTSDKFLPAKIADNTVDIYTRLKEGILRRNKEIDVVTSFIKKSPHPVLLCGDFNDTPYCYTYQKVNKLLQNSFEKAGSGFGFTYNRFPWFVRIDNQFYDKQFVPVSFKIFKDNTLSDHYPMQVNYKFNN